MKDHVGEKYGMLTVVEDLGSFVKEGTKKKRRYMKCLCDCGNEFVVRLDCLKSGNNKSCGCLQFNHAIKTHGMTGSKLYAVWATMKDRVLNKNSKAYVHYGQRGIEVCEEWINSFESFHKWAMESGYKEGLTIERIDVNGNYEPNNCKWISQKEQNLNTRRNVFIEYEGKNQTLKEWSEELGIKYMTLFSRIRIMKWPVERAFNEPVDPLVNSNDYPEKE